MVYLLKILISHGYVSHNQMGKSYLLNIQSEIPKYSPYISPLNHIFHHESPVLTILVLSVLVPFVLPGRQAGTGAEVGREDVGVLTTLPTKTGDDGDQQGLSPLKTMGFL